MKSFILLLSLLFTHLWAQAADKIVSCNFVPGRCECQVMEQTAIQSDGFVFYGTQIHIKQCPGHIRDKLSSEYLRYMHQWSNRPDSEQEDARYNVPLPEPIPGFNDSPFARVLAMGLSDLFGRHQSGPTQSYLDQLRSWNPIDSRMAQDMENFRRERADAQGKLSQGDKEILDYLQELIKQSQDLTKESKLPRAERPTPLPKSVNSEEIREAYKGLYESAGANRPRELEERIQKILKRLNSMSNEERTFHQTELSRTFLRSDLTFKSLPYVKNPELSLKSDPASPAGIATRGQINQLMAAQSEALQRLHGHCEANKCSDPDKLVYNVNHDTRQLYKSIELRDQLSGTLVEDREYNKLSKELYNDYSTGLTNVRTEDDYQNLKNELDGRFSALQERRLGLKSELLTSNGGRYDLPESDKNRLSSLAGDLRIAAAESGAGSSAQTYRDLAEGALDLALGLVPVVSTAKDFFEMVSGESLISGEKLDTKARAILAVSVVVDVATVGVGGKVAKFALENTLAAVSKFIKDVPVGTLASKIIGKAEDVMIDMGAKKFTHVLQMPQGARPDPTTYLSGNYINRHLSKFEEGATRLMTEDSWAKYGPSHLDGASFVLPKKDVEIILSQAGGDRKKLEALLGLPEGHFGPGAIVRVDVPNPKEYNLRIPSGNEAAVNGLWIPGGKLPTGHLEAVVDIQRESPGLIKSTIDF